ncbi:MAG TPA: beta-N-acetylhexosaminidase, partial [Porphyromonadaceae bacterium]|nr:beta-N-acetylhexosaminidase [Porphyromonadaceae bacterium]
MKKFILLFTLSVFGLLTFGQQVERGISIIPEPVSVVKKGGYYVLPDNIVISAPAGDEMSFISEHLTKKLSTALGKKVTVRNNVASADIVLTVNAKTDTKIGNEGYTLSVTSGNVNISANKPAGLLYGVQTFLQLLP